MPRIVALPLAIALLASTPLPSGAALATLPAPAQDEPDAEIVPLAERGALLDPIMTERERADWQAARSDEARSAFLRAFWNQRDPTPGTELNEVREIFLSRARRAQRMFIEGSTPGFATDRGRVLLVHGLPREIEARSPDGGPAPEIVWSYAALEVRFQRRGDGYVADPPPALGNEAFVAGTGEEVRLMLAAAFGGTSEAPEQAPVTLDPATDDAGDDAEDGAIDGDDTEGTEAGDDGAEGGDDVEAAPATGAAAIAPEVRIWMQLVQGGVQRDDMPLRSALRTFPAQGGTYVALGFHVGAGEFDFVEPVFEPVILDEEAEPEAAEVEEAEETEEEVGEETEAEEEGDEDAEQELELPLPEEALPEGPVAELKVFGAFLQGEPGSETTVHQFIIPVTLAEAEVVDGESPLLSVAVTLVPGTYRLAWGVLDVANELAVTRDTTVEIPDYAGAGLTITDPLVARPPHQTATDEMSTQSIHRGVRLGNVLINDDIDRTFGRDETLELVTVVTGWASDPSQPGRPRLEVLYRILEGDEDFSIARLQPQILNFHVLGQQIPLSQVQQLESGKDYRILIEVTDSTNGEKAQRQVPISIRAAEVESEG